MFPTGSTGSALGYLLFRFIARDATLIPTYYQVGGVSQAQIYANIAVTFQQGKQLLIDPSLDTAKRNRSPTGSGYI